MAIGLSHGIAPAASACCFLLVSASDLSPRVSDEPSADLSTRRVAELEANQLHAVIHRVSGRVTIAE